MDGSTIISLAIGSAGTITGIVGLFFAHASKKIAEKANRVAKDSVIKAEEANRIATQANEIASNANTLSERALATSQDQSAYGWRVEVDYDIPAINVENDTHMTVFDVAVTARYRADVIGQATFGQVGPFETSQVVLDLPVKEHVDDAVDIAPDHVEGFARRVIYHGQLIKAYVGWVTSSGVQRSWVTEREL